MKPITHVTAVFRPSQHQFSTRKAVSLEPWSQATQPVDPQQDSRLQKSPSSNPYLSGERQSQDVNADSKLGIGDKIPFIGSRDRYGTLRDDATFSPNHRDSVHDLDAEDTLDYITEEFPATLTPPQKDDVPPNLETNGWEYWPGDDLAGYEQHSYPSEHEDAPSQQVADDKSRTHGHSPSSSGVLGKSGDRTMSFENTSQAGQQSGTSQNVGHDPLAEALMSSGNSFPLYESRSSPISSTFRSGIRWSLARHIEFVRQNPSTFFPSFSNPRGYITKEESHLLEFYTDRRLASLRQKGVSVRDLESWRWVLSTPYADRAAWRLVELAKTSGRDPPLFLLLYILRAKSLRPSAVNLLLEYSKASYIGAVVETQNPTDTATDHNLSGQQINVDGPSFMILIVRLLRHARQVLPHRIYDITELACNELRILFQIVPPQSPSAMRRTEYFNRLLSLLSHPADWYPFRLLPTLEKSQFRVLREMTNFSPHVPISQEGYRAMIRTQVARIKTTNEKEWADFKSPTWPPWKRDRSGLDAGKFFEGSISRARHVLDQLVASGYQPETWEKAATILSGSDLDDSPTIQTRKFLPRTLGKASSRLRNATIAKCRIQATRTIREAWGCFLEYERECQAALHKSDAQAYEAMLQKLLAPQPHIDSETVPGDGTETYPEPESSHDWLYLSEEPPTARGLITRMRRAGIAPNDRIIEMQMKFQDDLASAVAVLQYNDRLGPFVPLLLRAEQYEDEIFRNAMANVNPGILSAYMGWLGRPISRPRFHGIRTTFCDSPGPRKGLLLFGPRVYGLHLLKKLGPGHARAWNAFLFETLAHIGSPLRNGGKILEPAHWSTISNILSEMNQIGAIGGLEVFDRICDRLCDLLPVDDIQSGPSAGTGSSDGNAQILSTLKKLFTRLIWDSSQSIEALVGGRPLFLPFPFTLLTFVRVLGLCGDYSGILSVLSLMVNSAGPLTAIAYENPRHERQFREVFIAIRIHLERLWADHKFLRGAEPRQSYPEAVSAQAMILNVEEWYGWPSDDEVRNSIRRALGTNDWVSRMRKRLVYEREREKEPLRRKEELAESH